MDIYKSLKNLDLKKGAYISFIDIKSIVIFGSDYSTQNIAFNLRKDGGTGIISITSRSATTMTADRFFRVQFDLLIDADYSE